MCSFRLLLSITERRSWRRLNVFRFNHLRRIPGADCAALLAAAPSRPERDAARCQLLLLRLVGLALPVPHGGLDAGRLLRGAWHQRLGNDRQRRRALLCLFAGAEFRVPGFLQILQFLRRVIRCILRQPWACSAVPTLVWKIVLPPAISFYTFQEVAYIVDVYKRKLRAGGLAGGLCAVRQPVSALDRRPDPAALAPAAAGAGARDSGTPNQCSTE